LDSKDIIIISSWTKKESFCGKVTFICFLKKVLASKNDLFEIIESLEEFWLNWKRLEE